MNVCDQEQCGEPATHSYTWEWGLTGVCCSKHQVVISQTAGNLARSVHFAAISDGAAPVLQREERVRLRAEALVLAEELKEAKERGLDLYRQNGLLTQQVQSLTVRVREAEAQRKDAITARDEYDDKLAKLESENAELSDELGRLRVLVDVPTSGSAKQQQPSPQ